MTTVLLIIQLLAAIGLSVVILMQRSEGGALGIGGGGGGGMMSGRGAANLLTRTTMVLAAIFIGNSIALAVVTGVNSEGESIFENQLETTSPLLDPEEEEGAPVPTDG